MSPEQWQESMELRRSEKDAWCACINDGDVLAFETETARRNGHDDTVHAEGSELEGSACC
jgi:hypothetical protein